MPIKEWRQHESPTTFPGVEIPPLPEPNISIVQPDIDHMPMPDMYPLAEAKNAIMGVVMEFAGTNDPTLLPVCDSQKADYAIACHKFAASRKKSRDQFGQVAQSVAGEIQGKLHVQTSFTESGFVNIELDPTDTAQSVLQRIETMKDRYGEQNIGNGETAVIDLSSPNIAKHFSVGHLRSTIIGESLARLYRTAGYTVIRDNHIGDWGTQFGMLGRAYELWGKEIPELDNPQTQVEGLFKLYVQMNTEIEKEKSKNPDQPSALEQEGRDWFRKLENGDEKAKAMYRWALELSFEEFNRVYYLLGCDFEYVLGESFYVPMLSAVNQAIKRSGMTTDIGGALAIVFNKRPKNQPLDIIREKMSDTAYDDPSIEKLFIQKRDGTSLYATRDLATLAARTAWFDPERIVYVVGGEQREYFRQVFKVFEEWTGNHAPLLIHVPFGAVTLPEGKMSTRKGRVVFLENVLNESIHRAKKKIRSINRDLTQEDIDTIARQVGVGAVIFMDLGQAKDRTIVFDWEKALSLEGNSSPYIQYTYARAQSILRKASDQYLEIYDTQPRITSTIERQLVMLLGRFPEIISEALHTHEPSKIAEYVLRLSDRFNQFYHQNPVIKENDPEIRNTRLRLTQATSQVIKNALHLLCIEAPEKM